MCRVDRTADQTALSACTVATEGAAARGPHTLGAAFLTLHENGRFVAIIVDADPAPPARACWRRPTSASRP